MVKLRPPALCASEQREGVRTGQLILLFSRVLIADGSDGTICHELNCQRMSKRIEQFVSGASLGREATGDSVHWVEIFKERVAEPLKEILQDDMDWMTSLPILERLNRLHEIEKSHIELETSNSEVEADLPSTERDAA
jgi:hypothetical protein